MAWQCLLHATLRCDHGVREVTDFLSLDKFIIIKVCTCVIQYRTQVTISDTPLLSVAVVEWPFFFFLIFINWFHKIHIFLWNYNKNIFSSTSSIFFSFWINTKQKKIWPKELTYLQTRHLVQHFRHNPRYTFKKKKQEKKTWSQIASVTISPSFKELA